MEASSLNQTQAWVIALLLFILMLFSSFVGKLAGNYRNKKGKKENPLKLLRLQHCCFCFWHLHLA
jgi:hypothetical protein